MNCTKQIVSTFLFVLIFITSIAAYAAGGTDFYLDKGISISGTSYTSPEIKFENSMDRAVLSWNAETPEDSFIELMLRTRSEHSRWSNWFKMGIWGESIESKSIKGQVNRFGKVDIDTLELMEPAKTWQYKLVLHKGKNNSTPIIYSIALAAKNSKIYKKENVNFTGKIGPLKVPVFSQFETSQKENKPELAKRICSPTSVAMVLKFNQAGDISPIEVASKTYDHSADAFGNWPFNTAVLFSYLNKTKGADSFTTYVRWYESFKELIEHIRNGEPVIVSIGFKEGELKGAPIPTSGHLVVVKGADKKYVYVNDPAAPNQKSVSRKYLRSEFIKAWKGVAYIVETTSN